MQLRNKLISRYNKYLHNIHTANLFEQHYIYSQFFIHFWEMCGIDFDAVRCVRSSCVRTWHIVVWCVYCAWRVLCGAVRVAGEVWCSVRGTCGVVGR